MNFALQKTLELVLVIALGFFLQKKLSSKESLSGIKIIILSIALPATIFVALLKIDLDATLLIFPALALVFNLLMFLATKYMSGSVIPTDNESRSRTLTMLLPSLAPGLSCFPFIMVYSGDDSLALAALADVGNKIFVLILLYILAMRWYHSRSVSTTVTSSSSKLKSLVIALINEPINLVIIAALILLGFGLNINALPSFMSSTILRISAIMTPLVLLFIGMSAKIKWKDLRHITNILFWRAGLTFMLSGLFILLFPALSPALVLLILVFPQSSCSFWPFAHMSAVNSLEEKDNQTSPTFDIDFAISVMACSLPFSTLMIICIYSFSSFFTSPPLVLSLGFVMFALPLVYKYAKKYKKVLEQMT
ncbi:permease [Reichenbachiella agarivorans]|uniref:Permease n=1 Tax=Reichenbachiella agarivorans TaxID=2979464 RepID=A0ABY6CQA1_9BACT|nr:permease [Reichenbachiella agarivorans]UXP32676.1 permease [Reichenbachiella agarivorans]